MLTQGVLFHILKIEENVNYTDGIRILFDNGEISHLRPSGNAPEFRNYAIADSPERAREIVRIGIEKVIPRAVEIISLSSQDVSKDKAIKFCIEHIC